MFTVSEKPVEGSIWVFKWSDFDKWELLIHEVKADLNNEK